MWIVLMLLLALGIVKVTDWRIKQAKAIVAGLMAENARLEAPCKEIEQSYADKVAWLRAFLRAQGISLPESSLI
jgi:hypothetical protein